MDGSVKLFCGCAVALFLAAEGVAHMTPDDRRALYSEAQRWMGAAALPISSKAPPQTAPVAIAARATGSSFDSIVLPKNRWGQYEAVVEIDGQHVPMMVDTGATLLVLSHEDADRLGIRPAPSDFREWVSTANGRAAVARVNLREVRLGPIVVTSVEALVGARGALSTSLLGMTFLGRLRSVRVEDGQLALQQ